MMLKRQLKGIGLLELMLVLVVIAAILLMAVRYFGQASEDLKVNQAVKIIQNVTQSSFEWLKGNPVFDNNFKMSSLKGYVTENCSNGSGYCVQSPWGNQVEVRGYSSKQIQIFLQAPQEACQQIIDIMQRENMSGICDTYKHRAIYYQGIYPATTS